MFGVQGSGCCQDVLKERVEFSERSSSHSFTEVPHSWCTVTLNSFLPGLGAERSTSCPGQEYDGRRQDNFARIWPCSSLPCSSMLLHGDAQKLPSWRRRILCAWACNSGACKENRTWCVDNHKQHSFFQTTILWVHACSFFCWSWLNIPQICLLKCFYHSGSGFFSETTHTLSKWESGCINCKIQKWDILVSNTFQ